MATERISEEGKKRGRGRPRIYASDAERVREYDRRNRLLRSQIAELKEAFTQATERGRCVRLMGHLPDEPAEWIPLVIERLAGSNLVVCRREKPEGQE